MLFKLNLQQFAVLPPTPDPTDPDEPGFEITFTNNFYLDGTLVKTLTTRVDQSTLDVYVSQIYLTLSGNDIYGLVYGSLPTVETIIQSGQLIASNIDKSSFSTTGNGSDINQLRDASVLTAGTIYSVGYWGDSNTYFITDSTPSISNTSTNSDFSPLSHTVPTGREPKCRDTAQIGQTRIGSWMSKRNLSAVGYFGIDVVDSSDNTVSFHNNTGSVSIEYNCGSSNANKYAILYEDDGTTIKAISCVQIGSDGKANFTIEQFSDYSVSVSDTNVSLSTLNADVADNNDYLCFETEDTMASIEFDNEGLYTSEKPTLYYSKDNKQSWTQYTLGVPLGLASGEKCYFKGTSGSFSFSTSRYIHFLASTGNIKASGNIMSLLDETCTMDTIPNAYCFVNLFQDCTRLLTSPSLPAIYLKRSCYLRMFSGCTNLTNVPELPCQYLPQSCYAEMFAGCTSITDIHSFNINSVGEESFRAMFSGCTSLKLSSTQTGKYTKAWAITSAVSISGNAEWMFANTGGTFTGVPSENTTYYIWYEPVEVKNCYFGSNQINAFYFGSSSVSAIYYGTTPIYVKVEEPWEDPVQDGENLTVTQTYLATQDNNELIIQ